MLREVDGVEEVEEVEEVVLVQFLFVLRLFWKITIRFLTITFEIID